MNDPPSTSATPRTGPVEPVSVARKTDAAKVSFSHPTFAEAFRFWLRLGFISFGSPTGQIAIMHTELVDQRRWVSESRFLHALNYCMLLPGPKFQQLATYVGWFLHRTWGGIVAGSLFVLPSVVILWTLSYIYARGLDVADRQGSCVSRLCPGGMTRQRHFHNRLIPATSRPRFA